MKFYLLNIKAFLKKKITLHHGINNIDKILKKKLIFALIQFLV